MPIPKTSSAHCNVFKMTFCATAGVSADPGKAPYGVVDVPDDLCD